MDARPYARQARTSDRLIPTKHLRVLVHGLPVAADLWDVSLGGFAISCARPFQTGSKRRFTVAQSRLGASITVTAEAIHCRAVSSESGLVYISGWRFTSASAEEREAIRLLYEAATTPASPPA